MANFAEAQFRKTVNCAWDATLDLVVGSGQLSAFSRAAEHH